jgi:hypothetical protein
MIGLYKNMREDKQIKQTPHEIKNILGDINENLKILKIGGSRDEFLYFDTPHTFMIYALKKILTALH